jgi:2-polyprenyl-3-methyl-5-hydroxy-6-metoxy-1,4-benzoquinol methylase
MRCFDIGINKIIKRMMDGLEVERILDIGSNSSTVDFLKEIFPHAEIHSLNIDKKALKEVSKNHKGVRTVFCDCQDMRTFKSNYFDLIFSNQVLEHVFYPEKCLHECYKTLKRDGVMILTTPNLASWQNRLLLLFGYHPTNYTVSSEFKNLGFPKFIKKKNLYDHPRVFTVRALKEILEKTGFKILGLKVINHTYSGQEYRILRFLLNMILPANWKENIVVKVKPLKQKD